MVTCLAGLAKNELKDGGCPALNVDSDVKRESERANALRAVLWIDKHNPNASSTIARGFHVTRTMRTSQLSLDSVSEHDTAKAQSRPTTRHPRHLHGP